MTERPEGLDDLLDHLVEMMDTVSAARQLREALSEKDWNSLVFKGSTLSALLDRVDRYEKNLPSWRNAAPEDVDAWLRDLIPDDKRLAFYQWIGGMAVTEALLMLEDNLREDPRDPQGQHYHRDDVYEMLDIVDPRKTGDSFPEELPLGRPFCNVPHHTHTHGGGRLPTCRLDSKE